MRKVEEPTARFDVGIVRVYRDDLDEIADRLTSVCGSVTIRSGGYEFESLDELQAKRGDRPKELDIACSEYGISVMLADDVCIFANAEHRALALEIKELLIQRRRPFAYNTVGVLLRVLAVLLPVMFAVPMLGSGSANLIAGGLFVGISFALFARRTVILLKLRHEHETFWKRHEDNLIRGAISVVSAIVGGMVVYYLKK